MDPRTILTYMFFLGYAAMMEVRVQHLDHENFRQNTLSTLEDTLCLCSGNRMMGLISTIFYASVILKDGYYRACLDEFVDEIGMRYTAEGHRKGCLKCSCQLCKMAVSNPHLAATLHFCAILRSDFQSEKVKHFFRNLPIFLRESDEMCKMANIPEIPLLHVASISVATAFHFAKKTLSDGGSLEIIHITSAHLAEQRAKKYPIRLLREIVALRMIMKDDEQ